MPDPTVMILSGTFAAAFGIFVISAVLRMARGGGSGPVRQADPGGVVPESPYQAPEAVPVIPPRLPFGKIPVWFYRAPDLLGIGFIFAVFSGLVLGSLHVVRESVPKLTAADLVVNIGFQFIIAGVVCILVLRRVSLDVWLGIRWKAWPWVFLIAPGAVVFMWMIFGGLQFSGYVKWMESLGVETVQDTVKLLQESADPMILGLMAFAAVIAAPLCEEIVFRGYFYPVMKRYAGTWPAVICSALVFASAHGSLTALLPLFIFGLVLVFIYEKTGSLWAPVAVHFCFNGATVAVQMAARYFDIPLDAAS